MIGTVQVAGFALGFLFLSLYHGVLESLESLLFGSFLGITQAQVETLLGVALATLAFFAVAGRPAALPLGRRAARAGARGAGEGAARLLPARARARGGGDGADHRGAARVRAARRAGRPPPGS